MKIGIVAGYSPSVLGFRKRLIMALCQHAEVTVFSPYENLATLQSILSLGVNHFIIPFNRTGANPFSDLSTLSLLVKQFKLLKIDTVLSYTIKPVIWGSLAAHLAGIKNIYALITGLGYSFSEINTLKQRFIHRIVVKLYKQSLHYNKTIFFQNQDDLNLFQQKRIISSAKQCMILNGSGVDLHHFLFSPLPSMPMRFLMIARLLKDKGVYEYIKAAELVKMQYPHVEFHLVGWVDQNPTAIDQRILDAAIEKNILIFHGRLHDVREQLKSCHVFVLPSYREGTPVSVLEALATGRAIITTDAPGCRETVIENKNGFLVAIKNVTQLTAAMIRLIEQPHLIVQMSYESRKLAEEKYDVNKINQCMLEAMNVRSYAETPI